MTRRQKRERVLEKAGPTKIFDVVLIADMTRSGDIGLRISREIRTLFDMGLDVGLLHLKVSNKGAFASPDIGLCLREGIASVLPVGDMAVTKLAIVYSPEALTKPTGSLSALKAEKVVLVHDKKPKEQQMGRWFSFEIGKMIWAPTNRWVRASLEKLAMPVPLSGSDWRPIAKPLREKSELSGNRQLIVGRVSVPGPAQWPETVEELEKVYPRQSHFDFRVMGPPSKELMKKLGGKNWNVLLPRDVAVERFIEALDVFMYYPLRGTPEMPEAAIAVAMASGKLVILPPNLKPHFGAGAIYCNPADALNKLNKLLEHPKELEARKREAVYYSGFQFSEQAYKERIGRLLGLETLPETPAIKKKRTKRVLFIPSNGVGLGHVTRTLSIARRLDRYTRPIFLTNAQAVPIIEGFGFPTEYFVSHTDSGSEFKTWDIWFRHELAAAIEKFDIDGLVYDGNNPSQGLVHAALSSGSCRLAWVRRGMLGDAKSPFIENSRFFDLIIEPGDIASERDHGVTVARRHETLQVGPIKLLNDNERLTRKEARIQLGLDPEKPAALLHLGAGKNRDVVALLDTIIQKLQIFPTLQLVIAQWSNGLVKLPNWPGTISVNGYPISRYYNAFNFSIGSAGYNTFHEVVAAGLPTVFIPNTHPSMDDQEARAEFIQEQGAGFHLPEDQLFHLPALCEALMNEKICEVVSNACAEQVDDNGAQMAADAISELVRS